MSALRCLASCCCLLAGLARPTVGQAVQTATDKGKKADAAVALYTVPESPAFTFLDITPAKITKPTTARDFVTSLINAIDEGGHVKQGFAFEVEGSRLAGRRPTLAEYQQRGTTAILSRSQLSMATVRAAGDTSSTDLAYGVRIPLYDRGDPMADVNFTGAVIEEFARCSRGRTPPLPTADPEVQKAQMERTKDEQKRCEEDALKKEGEQYGKGHWNDVNLSLAYAGGHRLISSLATDARELGNRVWLVGGGPILGRAGQLLGLLQYANMVPSADSVHETSLRLGARATVGQPTLNGFLEVFREHRSPKGLPSLERNGWSGGLEVRMSEQLWLATGFGRATDVKGSPTVMIANLKWALSDQAQFARP